MYRKVAVHRLERRGVVEYHGLPPASTAVMERVLGEAERIILEPPGVIRDTVALAIRASLVDGEQCGNVEGVCWESLPDRCGCV